MRISESLFLLLRRDDGKPESAMAQRGYGLAAGAITDLVLVERVTLGEEKDPRMTVLDPRPVGHRGLDASLTRLVERDGKKLSSLVTDGRVAAEQQVGEALAAGGVLEVEERRLLGLVPARYPVRDPEPERALRERLRVVLQGGTPDPREATVLAILEGLQVAANVLEEERGTLGKKDLKRRIEVVSEDVVAGEAVGRAVRAMNTAIMTAAILPVVIGGSGG